LILDRPDGAVVVLFDPVRDAPGWSGSPAFPAFFYAALRGAPGDRVADGLLSPADTRLGAVAVAPRPLSVAPDPDAAGGVDSLTVWLLLVAALALVGICLLEV
jgi:hypothetical protein